MTSSPKASASSGVLFRYVFDASSLINIERAKKTPLLRANFKQVLIPVKVAIEVNQKNSPLQRFLKRYPHVVTELTEAEGLTSLQLLARPSIHDGEAEAIAVAYHRNLALVMDDGQPSIIARGMGIATLKWTDYTKK